ncbi:MAG: DUF2358 domain-containing protein [Cyanobacteria bacterium Co-bin13]|nr:DUF2358 domain-containing protein [Cyanobacteria bacterium Co-bin13]
MAESTFDAPVGVNPPDPQAVEQVVKTLQADLPALFEQDITYDIYTSDILFKDPVNRFKGKFNYRIIFWTLRFHGRLFFTELFFDLHGVKPVAPEQIRADWTVRGSLRLPWQTRLFFNGFSIYRLTSEAQIYEHVDTWDRSPGEILRQFLPQRSSP